MTDTAYVVADVKGRFALLAVRDGMLNALKQRSYDWRAQLGRAVAFNASFVQGVQTGRIYKNTLDLSTVKVPDALELQPADQISTVGGPLSLHIGYRAPEGFTMPPLNLTNTDSLYSFVQMRSPFEKLEK